MVETILLGEAKPKIHQTSEGRPRKPPETLNRCWIKMKFDSRNFKINSVRFSNSYMIWVQTGVSDWILSMINIYIVIRKDQILEIIFIC